MTIACFHRQVQLGGGGPLLEKLNALREAEALRSQLEEPEGRPFRTWMFWL